MSFGATGGMNVVEGALRSSPYRNARIGDVDLPRDGIVLFVLLEIRGVVRAKGEAGRATEKF